MKRNPTYKVLSVTGILSATGGWKSSWLLPAAGCAHARQRTQWRNRSRGTVRTLFGEGMSRRGIRLLGKSRMTHQQ